MLFATKSATCRRSPGTQAPPHPALSWQGPVTPPISVDVVPSLMSGSQAGGGLREIGPVPALRLRAALEGGPELGSGIFWASSFFSGL